MEEKAREEGERAACHGGQVPEKEEDGETIQPPTLTLPLKGGGNRKGKALS